MLRLELHCNPHLLGVVRGAVERLAEVLGFSAQGCRSFTRAEDEALSNITRHSYSGRLDEPIAMYFRHVLCHSNGGAGGGLEVQLWDRGLEFVAKNTVVVPAHIEKLANETVSATTWMPTPKRVFTTSQHTIICY